MYGYPSHCIARIDNVFFMELAGLACFEAGLRNRVYLRTTVYDFSVPPHFDIIGYANDFNYNIRQMKELSNTQKP
jgi:hypothetical protein